MKIFKLKNVSRTKDGIWSIQIDKTTTIIQLIEHLTNVEIYDKQYLSTCLYVV